MRTFTHGVLGAAIVLVGASAFLSGCGGATPAPDSPAASIPLPATAMPEPSMPSTGASAVTPGPISAGSTTTSTSTTTATTNEAWSDPNEKPDRFALTPLFDKSKVKSSFPRKSTSDADCWTTVSPTGNHTHDYDAIIAACGTPTGLVEYAKPVEGKLHHQRDPRDIYSLKLAAGYCYRYFAVADGGISDLDVLIEKPGGALVGDDKTTSPIAIIESDKPWCIDDDETLEFHVKVDGVGSGGYTFGVWARPKH